MAEMSIPNVGDRSAMPPRSAWRKSKDKGAKRNAAPSDTVGTDEVPDGETSADDATDEEALGQHVDFLA